MNKITLLIILTLTGTALPQAKFVKFKNDCSVSIEKPLSNITTSIVKKKVVKIFHKNEIYPLITITAAGDYDVAHFLYGNDTLLANLNKLIQIQTLPEHKYDKDSIITKVDSLFYKINVSKILINPDDTIRLVDSDSLNVRFTSKKDEAKEYISNFDNDFRLMIPNSPTLVFFKQDIIQEIKPSTVEAYNPPVTYLENKNIVWSTI